MASAIGARLERLDTFPKGAKSKYLVNVVVETPRGTRHKFAFNTKTGLFELRATIAEGLEWPYDYGFIPQTLGADGDPLDVLFLIDEPTFPCCLAQGRLIGIVRLQKDGEENDRLLACANRLAGIAQSTDDYDDVDDIPKESIESICRCLVEYSEEQDHAIKFKGVASRKKALRALKRGMKTYQKRNKRK